MKTRLMLLALAACGALAWTPGGDYPGGAAVPPAAVYDPLATLIPYSANVQVTGRVATNDVAVFTDRTGRYLRGTNMVHLLAGLAPEAINAGMSNYLAAAEAAATNAAAQAGAAAALAALATNLTGQATAALAVQSNLTDTAYAAATNAAAEAAAAYAAATNAAAEAAAAYAAGTNAQAGAEAVAYLAEAGYAAGTNGLALAQAAGTNASAAAAAAGLAYVAATNAQAEAAQAAFDAALAAADLEAAMSAATNAQDYAYIALTNSASAAGQAALAMEGHAAATNAAAQAAAVYAVATNAQALAQSAQVSASAALALAGSYYAIATNAAAVAAAAAADVGTAYTAATNAAAQAAAVYALAADKGRLEGYTGISTNLVWMDVEGLPDAAVTARLWRALAPTAMVWQAAVPLLTNILGAPLAQTGMETQWWHAVPYPLEWPASGPVVYTNRSSTGAWQSMTALTNLTGGVDVYHGNTRASNYLAVATLSQENYLAGGPFVFSILEEGITGTVTFARGLPPAATNLAGLVAQEAWVSALVTEQVGALSAEVYWGLWVPFDEHTNNLANPHQVTAAQTGALTNETDETALAALAAHAAYWPPDATARDWFTFTTNNNEITITGYNIDGGTDVIVPEYINGIRVTVVNARAFSDKNITSFAASSILNIGEEAFSSEGSQSALKHISIPAVTNIADLAFYSRPGITSVVFSGAAPAIGSNIYYGSPSVTNYVTNPQATGWGDTLGGMPVVRLPLYADAMYQAGQLVATTGHVAQAIAAIPEPDLSGKVDAVSGNASNLWLAGETIVSDSHTNLWWRNVYSNGWHWLVAYTNAPGGGE